MASLKEVRTRIESVKSTQQITSAMKMVSASKLRKAQTVIHGMQPYAKKMETLLQRVFQPGENQIISPLNEYREPHKILLIAVSSNRGLCGPFNANIARVVIQRASEHYESQYQNGNIEIFTIGKKVYEYLVARKIKVARRYDELIDKFDSSTVNNLAATLMTDFNTKKYDRVEVIYHHFKNAAVQVITTFQLLPFENPADNKPVKPQDDFDYIYEPSLDKVLEALIPKWLNLKIYEILADSSASEHGARMIAMHKATDNATELLSELKLSYNKARQSAITNELIEIIGGAEAFQK